MNKFCVGKLNETEMKNFCCFLNTQNILVGVFISNHNLLEKHFRTVQNPNTVSTASWFNSINLILKHSLPVKDHNNQFLANMSCKDQPRGNFGLDMVAAFCDISLKDENVSWMS